MRTIQKQTKLKETDTIVTLLNLRPNVADRMFTSRILIGFDQV